MEGINGRPAQLIEQCGGGLFGEGFFGVVVAGRRHGYLGGIHGLVGGIELAGAHALPPRAEIAAGGLLAVIRGLLFARAALDVLVDARLRLAFGGHAIVGAILRHCPHLWAVREER